VSPTEAPLAVSHSYIVELASLTIHSGVSESDQTTSWGGSRKAAHTEAITPAAVRIDGLFMRPVTVEVQRGYNDTVPPRGRHKGVRHEMGTRIELGDDELVIRLGPVASLLTFRRTVRVPRRSIADVRAERRGDLEPHIEHRISGIGPHYGWRLPNRRRVGPMLRRGAIGAEFWVVDEGSADQELIVCELEGHRYARLVIGLESGEGLEKMLSDWISRRG